MKRLLSWMLVLCMALSLVPAGLAEELFAEESFFDASSSKDEEIFAEEGFFGDDSLFTPAEEELDVESRAFFDAEDKGEEEDQDEDAVIESRSIVSLITDWEAETVSTDGDNYWKKKPTLKVSQDAKKSDVLILEWSQAIAQNLPKDVKYYIYEIDNETGVAYQVGKPVKAKKVDGGFGNKIKLKKLEGEFLYFVRAEKLVLGDKANKLYHESYGISSDKVGGEAYLATWKKKVTKLAAVQQGTEMVVTFTDSNNVSGFKVTVLKNKAPVKDYTFLFADEISGQSDMLTSSGSNFTFRWSLPADYADNDAYSFKVEPLKKVKSSSAPLVGTAATSKPVKVVKNDKWKTLVNFSVKEVENYETEASVQPTVAGAVKISWAYSTEEGATKPTSFVITGLLGGVTLNINDDKVSTVDKKNSVVSATATKDEANKLVNITVVAKTKLAASAKISVQPKQGKVKGVKTTTTVALRGLAQPKILSGEQTGDSKVTIRFTMGSVPEKDEQFILTGFVGKVTLTFDGKKFDNSNAKLVWNEDTQQDDIIELTGDVKVGNKAAVKKFTVKAKLGKKTSKASAKFSVAIRPSTIAAALNVKFGAIEEGSDPKMDVTFDMLNAASDLEEINVSVVSGDSFTEQPDTAKTYQAKKQYSKGEVKVENGKGTATFTGIKAGQTYSAFVEVILKGGRIVDSVTSIAAGEKIKDPRLVITDQEKIKAFQDALAAGNGYTYGNDGKKVWVGDEVPLPVNLLYKDGTDLTGVTWQAYIDGKAVTLDGANYPVEDNGTSVAFRLRPVLDGVPGDWVEDLNLEAYKTFSAKIEGKDKAWAKEQLTIEVTGGSGEFTAKVNDAEVKKEDLPNPVYSLDDIDTGHTKDFKVEVIDINLYDSDGKPLSVSATITVEKSEETNGDDEASKAFIFKIADKKEEGKKYVQVVGYNADKYVGDDTNKSVNPKVPAKATIEGDVYTIVEIGNSAFKDDVTLVGITLPNAIETIGESAFSGCTNLASMTCY